MLNALKIIEDGDTIVFKVTKDTLNLFTAQLSFATIKPYFNPIFENVVFDLEKLVRFDSSFISLLINTANHLNIHKKKLG
jgi:anti-anti-sigma regulatory factor